MYATVCTPHGWHTLREAVKAEKIDGILFYAYMDTILSIDCVGDDNCDDNCISIISHSHSLSVTRSCFRASCHQGLR